MEKKTEKKTKSGHGGARAGAGRPKEKTEEAATFKLNAIQRKMLAEMGDGDINKGIQALIDQHL